MRRRRQGLVEPRRPHVHELVERGGQPRGLGDEINRLRWRARALLLRERLHSRFLRCLSVPIAIEHEGRGLDRGPGHGGSLAPSSRRELQPSKLLLQVVQQDLGDLQLRQVPARHPLYGLSHLLQRDPGLPPLPSQLRPPPEHPGRPLPEVRLALLLGPPLLLLPVLVRLLPQIPGQEDRQSEAVEGPALRAGEAATYGLRHLDDRLRGHVLPGVQAHQLPAREALVEHHPGRLVELEALLAPPDVEARRIPLGWIPRPLLVWRDGSRASVPTIWDTLLLAVDNLRTACPRQVEQRPPPSLDHVGRRRLDQLRARLAVLEPPGRVDHVVTPRVPALPVRPADQHAAIQERARGAVHGGLRQPRPLRHRPHGQRHPDEAIPVVRTQHGAQQLVEHRPLYGREPQTCHCTYHSPRDPGVVRPPSRTGDRPAGWLKTLHGRPQGAAFPPPPGCRPRAADVPRPRANTRGHRRSWRSHSQ